MEQTDKDLLLKDLSERLPYGVVVKTPQGDGYINEISLGIFGHELGVNIKATERTRFKLEECKPYLRTLDSMNKEEYKEWQYYKNAIVESCDERLEERIRELHDWFDANKFDYRGLIHKGLAVEATEVIIHL